MAWVIDLTVSPPVPPARGPAVTHQFVRISPRVPKHLVPYMYIYIHMHTHRRIHIGAINLFAPAPSISFHPSTIYSFTSIYPPTCLFIHPSIHPSTYPSFSLSICFSIHLSTSSSIHLSNHPSTSQSIYISIHLSTLPLIHLSIHLSLHQSCHPALSFSSSREALYIETFTAL